MHLGSVKQTKLTLLFDFPDQIRGVSAFNLQSTVQIVAPEGNSHRTRALQNEHARA